MNNNSDINQVSMSSIEPAAPAKAVAKLSPHIAAHSSAKLPHSKDTANRNGSLPEGPD